MLEQHAETVRSTIAAVTAGANPDAVLFPEPAYAFDRSAIAVHMTGGKVGYIPRSLASALQPAIASAAAAGRPVACPAQMIAGHGSPRIILRIQIAGLGIDPASLR